MSASLSDIRPDGPSPPSGPENGGLRLLGAITAGTFAVVVAVLAIRAGGWPALVSAFLLVLAVGGVVLWVVAAMMRRS